jgi:hypothetical protein
MAKIGNKNLENLTDWDLKELRKLRIMLKNRISALELAPKKSVAESHPLHNMDLGECKDLLLNVQRAEKKLSM